MSPAHPLPAASTGSAMQAVRLLGRPQASPEQISRGQPLSASAPPDPPPLPPCAQELSDDVYCELHLLALLRPSTPEKDSASGVLLGRGVTEIAPRVSHEQTTEPNAGGVLVNAHDRWRGAGYREGRMNLR